MEFRKVISVPEWDDACKQKVIAFWRERGVVFADTHGDTLLGNRGSYLCNLTSFDMSKIFASLTVHPTGSEIMCVLSVYTAGQDITEWNRAYWQLELDTLESWLLHGDRKEALWKEFIQSERKARLRWTATLGRQGRNLTPEIAAMLSRGGEHILLRAAETMPATELLRPSSETESAPPQELLRGSGKPDKI